VSDASWWVLTLAVIGALALLTGVVGLFFKLGRRPSRIWIDEPVHVGTDAFLHAVAHALNAPLLSRGRAVLLNDGDEYYPRILQAIRGAQHTVNMTCYIWEPGEVSDAFFEVLVERAKAGVEVRLLLDGLGCMRTPREDIDRLEKAGGRVAWFRSLRFGKLMRFHKRTHRRAFVVDGRIGFTGGAAIGDKWQGRAQDPDHWRDVMIEVTGCMALNLQPAFAELWAYAGQEILSGDGHYPIQDDPHIDGDADTRHLHVVSSPADDSHPLRLLFLLTFFGARKRLWIASPYFVPDAFTREVLESRARLGVDVRVLVPNELSDAKPVRWATRSYYDELLSAGVRIFEYQPTMMHSKMLVADSIWSIVGSANMDIRSKELNKENVLCIADKVLAAQIETAFLADLERSEEISLDEWRRRGIGERVLERVSVLFAEQY
jgi:cardiolipin synthase A/B